MSSAMTILNLQNVQKAPVQTQGSASKQASNTTSSFLNLLRNAANSGRIETSGEIQNNNLNKSAKLENTGKNIILNNGTKINDINNAEISLQDIADDSERLTVVLTKVLNGEAAELSEFGEAGIAEAIKKVTENIITEDEDGKKIDIGELLKILGVPAETIPMLIASVNSNIVADTSDNVNNVGNVESEHIREISSLEGIREVKTGQSGEPRLMLSTEEAADFIAEAAESIYSERTEGNIIGMSETVPEQVRENIADFAGIVEENADFSRAIAEYAVERIEANNAERGEATNTERVREIIIQALNGEQPEIEVLSAVRTSEASSDRSASTPTVFDILNSMRKSVNIANVQLQTELSEFDSPIQGTAKPVEFVNNVTISEFDSDDRKTADINIPNNNAETAGMNNLAGVVNAGANVQNSESEVNIENFAADISQIITEKAHGILTGRLQETDADTSFELRLRLKPAELGEIFMKISYRDGNVGVNIIAANAAAERAILSQMGDLRSSLNAQEINLAEFDVNHFNNYNQNTQNQNDSQSSKRQNNRNGSERIGLNGNINEVPSRQEAERREAVANYIKSRRIFYKTI